MTWRVAFDADNVVISKPGHDASNPSLADTSKIFDSEWLFGLQVLGSGVWTYPYEVSTYRDFSIPDYGFQPALLIRTKARPYYADVGTEYNFREHTDRPNTMVFTGVEMLYDRDDPSPTAHRFLSNTTVRIYRSDAYSAIEYHWLAINL
tara:strand:+ start:1186 stop:1632 length:447 start_codon:yes stop_codon:yes gene_type:complete